MLKRRESDITAYKKGARKLKVCPGWFGLREHKVRREKASVATAAVQAGEFTQRPFNRVSSVPRRPSGRPPASDSRLMHIERRLGAPTPFFFFKEKKKKLDNFPGKIRISFLLWFLNHTWGTCCQATAETFDPSDGGFTLRAAGADSPTLDENQKVPSLIRERVEELFRSKETSHFPRRPFKNIVYFGKRSDANVESIGIRATR